MSAGRRGHRPGGGTMKPPVLTVDAARDPETNAPRGGITSHTSFLYTISFQAPGFYERHGYRVSRPFRAIRRAPAASS